MIWERERERTGEKGDLKTKKTYLGDFIIQKGGPIKDEKGEICVSIEDIQESSQTIARNYLKRCHLC